MSVLYNIIYDQARKTFGKEPAIDKYDEWCEHYFLTCKALANDFEVEGLTETSKEVMRIHDEQIELNKRRK